MKAENYKVGHKFQHTEGYIVTVVEEKGVKFFDIENVGYSTYIDDEYILYEIK